MGEKTASRFRKKLRVYFRRCRITLLFCGLLVIGGVICLSRSGLPGFLQRPLLAALRERGLDLEFRRVRPRWYRGLVADDVRFGHANTNGTVTFRARSADLMLELPALLRGKLVVKRITIHQGGLAVNLWRTPPSPSEDRGSKIEAGRDAIRAADLERGEGEIGAVGATNGPERALRLDGIESSLRLLPDGDWVLDDFRATLVCGPPKVESPKSRVERLDSRPSTLDPAAGVRFILSGQVTHASAMRDWDLFQRPTPAPAGSMRERVRKFAEKLEAISFATPPTLRFHLEGDGRDPQTFRARLALQASDAQTRWGNLTNALLTAVLFPAASNSLARVEAELAAEKALTPWAEVNGFNLALNLGSAAGVTNRVSASVKAGATEVITPQARGTNLQFRGTWEQSLADVVPLSGEVELSVEHPSAALVGARQLHFRARLAPGTYATVEDPAWSWWTNLAPYRLDWHSEVTGLRSEKGVAEKISLSGLWLAPALVVSNLHADLKDGPLDGSAQLDVDTRAAVFQVASAFDAREARPFLRERSRAWLARFSWGRQPPYVVGSGAVTLPAWTNRQPDWHGEVLPTLRLAVEVTATNGGYLGVPADWVHTHVTYTNMIWHLPDLRAGNGAGRLQMEHIADDRSHDYFFRIQSSLDPRLVRPLLSTNAQRGLDFVGFSERPLISGEVWGRWRTPERIGFQARVALTNFSFRDQGMDSLTADLRYTNRVLEVFGPQVFRAGTQTLTAAGVTLNVDEQRIYFTNGFSTADPLVVARCIGPKTAASLEPYQFAQPPVVQAEGFAPLKTPGDADLRFKVDGGPFAWWRFNVPHVAGNVRWRGDSLTLNDLNVAFYEGQADGNAQFRFDDHPGTDFRFFFNVTNANLQQLLPDLFAHTNHLEGFVSGLISITNANSADPHSWFGWADCELRDGLIWEMPVLGLFSAPVDAITPGLGRSRMSEARGRVGITNSVMRFEKLEMRAPLLRLQFRGTVDFEGNVDAIAEAEPLRDAPLFGPLVRLTLKPVTKFFEYKVTGTLMQPRKEPLYLPTRMLFLPFHPFQTLEEIFSAGVSTNPPVRSPRN